MPIIWIDPEGKRWRWVTLPEPLFLCWRCETRHACFLETGEVPYPQCLCVWCWLARRQAPA